LIGFIEKNFVLKGIGAQGFLVLKGEAAHGLVLAHEQ
jgi:hypothetical protein